MLSITIARYHQNLALAAVLDCSVPVEFLFFDLHELSFHIWLPLFLLVFT
jgi:hypothetical protein